MRMRSASKSRESYTEGPAEFIRSHSKRGAIALGCFALFWCGGVGVANVMMGRWVLNQLHAQLTYIPTPAQVLASEVKIDSDSDSTTYSANVFFEYDAAGTRHTSNRFRHGHFTGNKASAQAIVDRYPVGLEFTAWRDPKDPRRAIAYNKLTGADFMFLVFLTPFNAAGLLLIAGVAHPFVRRSTRGAGETLLSDDGSSARLRLSDSKPIYSLIGFPAIICFGSSLFIAFVWGFDPPIQFPLIALGIAISVGVWQAVTTAGRLKRGDDDMILDRRTKSLTLPVKLRKELGAESIKFASIDRICAIEHRTSNDSDETVFYDVKMQPVGGNHVPVLRLMRMVEKERAESLAAWLREQTGAMAESGIDVTGASSSHPVQPHTHSPTPIES